MSEGEKVHIHSKSSNESKSGGNESGDVEDVEGPADVIPNPRTELNDQTIGQFREFEDLARYALNVDPSIRPPTPEVKLILFRRKIFGDVDGEDFAYGIGKIGKYTGKTVNGKASGHGVLTFQNGHTWMGQFFNGMMHGEGLYSSGYNEPVEIKMIQNYRCVAFEGHEIVPPKNEEEDPPNNEQNLHEIKQYLRSGNLEIGILSKHLKEILEIKEDQTIKYNDGIYTRYIGEYL